MLGFTCTVLAMPFRFSFVCDLLQRLEDNQGARSGVRTTADIIREWFRTHHPLISRDDQDPTALLSTLLPEKRSDRVYFLKEKRLQTIIGRGLGLGRYRIQQLSRWLEPGSGVDLGGCVESILKETVSGYETMAARCAGSDMKANCGQAKSRISDSGRRNSGRDRRGSS